jgi:ArsR family transcriptional regulator
LLTDDESGIFDISHVPIVCLRAGCLGDAMQDALRRFKAGIFQALAHPTRIAIVELLRDGEVAAGRIFEQLGVEQANASQHLAVLRARGIVLNRKEGNQVFYRIRDPLLTKVLDIMRRYFHAHLSEALAMLQEMEQDKPSK